MSNAQISPIDVSNTVHDTKTQIMDSSVCDLVPVKSLVTETISPRCQAYKAYPSHNLREDWAREQREQWILKMLEVQPSRTCSFSCSYKFQVLLQCMRGIIYTFLIFP
nr:uncharacterized protein LOC117275523 [Nicotiana tomentosiformis]